MSGEIRTYRSSSAAVKWLALLACFHFGAIAQILQNGQPKLVVQGKSIRRLLPGTAALRPAYRRAPRGQVAALERERERRQPLIPRA